jgi:oligopeptide/dipeptide ABC transporter ATP-binding protein
VSIRGQIFNLLRRLQDERGLAYAIVLHDMATVRVLGDDVFVLYLGESVELARQRTFRRPAHPYAIALLSASPIEAERRNIRRLELPDVGTSVSPPPSGCPFQPRCWLHRELGQPERCLLEKPLLSLIEPEHEVACHYADLSLGRATNHVRTSGRDLAAQPDQLEIGGS